MITLVVSMVFLTAILMKDNSQNSSESVSKQAFVATLKRFVAQYHPTELKITETRETESRYKWLAELKAKVGRNFIRRKLCSVVYDYTINGEQLLVVTGEQDERVVMITIHQGLVPSDVCVWLTAEFRKLSPTLSVKVSVMEVPEN